ncbi:TIGR02281 family clan AA aspartic protease [Ideonella sp. A 288]|uniref:retropepsin-like aspartic protease family protein n=1 Tax=Ideonella sp. A 288 TaxID=1962181 RepID=UPI000B4B636F|nr:retropepsin-like aspartic protease [Ideonella sp. A 288]
MRRPLALMLCWGACLAAQAQSVTLSGSLGSSKALLVIDGQPHTVAVGASVKGVTLRRLGDGEAEVEVGGKRATLRLGAPIRLGGDSGGAPGGSEIVIAAGPGGHFTSAGTINGKAVQFMVDTGATSIALSQSEANRIGLDWQRGRRGLSHTAGGTVPIHSVNLTSVKVGSVEVFNVDAVIVPAEMPMVLLGNSFLSRFSMRRDSDVMRLERR